MGFETRGIRTGAASRRQQQEQRRHLRKGFTAVSSPSPLINNKQRPLHGG